MMSYTRLQTVNRVQRPHGRAAAAYLLGAAGILGVGVWSDATEAAGTLKVLTRQTADHASHPVYRKAHGIYRNLYPALSQGFSALNDPVFAD